MRKVQDASGCLPLVELIRLDINVSAADNFVEVVDTNDVKPCAFPAFVIMAVRGIGDNDAEKDVSNWETEHNLAAVRLQAHELSGTPGPAAEHIVLTSAERKGNISALSVGA